jgi:hypothetical protein
MPSACGERFDPQISQIHADSARRISREQSADLCHKFAESLFSEGFVVPHEIGQSA